MDVDPGCDDAVALVAACGCGALDLLSVTTVAGNVPLQKTTRNALAVLSFAGRGDIPVGAGADGPLSGEPYTAEYAHGQDGLGGVPLPQGGEPEGLGALGVMARAVAGSQRAVTLVAVAPLTNVALFLERYPQLADNIRRIVLMGGSLGEGNVTPYAEFNAYNDPEAAGAVFASGLPVTMVGLDVTRLAVADRWIIGRLRATGEFGETVARLASYGGVGRDRALHDAVAVAAVAEPGILQARPARVEVVCERPERGRTVCVEGEPNAEVGVGLDLERFFKLLLGSVGALQHEKAADPEADG